MSSSYSPARLFSRDASVVPRAKKRARVRRIGFFGLFGIGNFGNDGSLEAMLEFVKKTCPTAELLCICAKPTEVGSKLGVRSVRINWRPKRLLLQRLDRFLLNIPREVASVIQTVRYIRGLDVLIMPGTGILDDFGTGPKGMPYWIFRWSLLARILGTKVVLVSIGAGPIHHPLSRWLMKTAATMAVYRSYRDTISRDFMNSMGLDVSDDRVCPDVAFALPEPDSLRNPSAEGEPITVGIGVMSYNGWRGDKAQDEAVFDAYLSKLQSFVSWLLAEGHRVRILMGDNADQSTVERLFRTIQNSAARSGGPMIVAEPAHSLHDVMEQIAETDLVVATRYHNVVCALKLGRPTLSIGYAAKNELLLKEMGLGDFCQHIDQLDVDLLIQQFRKLTAGRKRYEESIRETNAAFAETLRIQNALLLRSYL
jgi:polysaccharide pyruvyl transferase WcaK-like protein